MHIYLSCFINIKKEVRPQVHSSKIFCCSHLFVFIKMCFNREGGLSCVFTVARLCIYESLVQFKVNPYSSPLATVALKHFRLHITGMFVYIYGENCHRNRKLNYRVF